MMSYAFFLFYSGRQYFYITPQFDYMKKIIISFTLTLLSLSTVYRISAQTASDHVYTDKQDSIYSDILNEYRSYILHIPKTLQQKDIPFCIVYLLDGELYHTSVVGMTQLFSHSKVSGLPPTVVVGIISKNRTNDFTPTASRVARDGQPTLFAHAKGGGANRFLHFLQDELMPHIAKQIGTPAFSILMGHSYAGLFTYYASLQPIDGIDYYISIDPSFWWDNGSIMQMPPQWEYKKQIHLYTGFATQPRTDQMLTQPRWVDTFLSEKLPRLRRNMNTVESHRFDHEIHGTVAVPGFYDGIKTLFGKPIPR